MSITTINSWDALITTVFYKLLNSPVAHFYYKKSLQGSIHKNCARLAQLCRLLAQRIKQSSKAVNEGSIHDKSQPPIQAYAQGIKLCIQTVLFDINN